LLRFGKNTSRNTSHGFNRSKPALVDGAKKEQEDPEAIYFTDQELLEWSVVTVGSNPEALKENHKPSKKSEV
jgi:hypothetical protein